MSEVLLKLLRFFNIVVIFATFFAYLSPFISPHVTWFFAVFGLFYPVLLTLNFLFFFFWLWRKKTYCLFSLGCILLGWTHISGLTGFNFSQEKPTEPITVVTFNVRNFRSLFWGRNDRSEQQKAFRDAVKEETGNVEIMCLQEFSATKRAIGGIKKLFDLPYFKRYKSRGTAIFSKYPIKDYGRIVFEDTGNSCLWADLEIEKQIVRVYSVHLESSKISDAASQLKKDANLRDKETWSGIRGILGRYRRSTNRRVEQITQIKTHIAETDYPVIVCGDFNDTPTSFVYRKISEDLCDNFKEAGRGWGATYAGSIPMLKIDYIFTPQKKFRVYEHGVLNDIDISDHYPVFSQLELR